MRRGLGDPGRLSPRCFEHDSVRTASLRAREPREPEVPRGGGELRRRPESDRLTRRVQADRAAVSHRPADPRRARRSAGDGALRRRAGAGRAVPPSPGAVRGDRRAPRSRRRVSGARPLLQRRSAGARPAAGRVLWHATFSAGCGPRCERSAPAAPRRTCDIANSIGAPSAVRAVGAANGANPIPIVVPCHRIIGTSGALVGYGGGLDRKRWLLEHEGVLLKM